MLGGIGRPCVNLSVHTCPAVSLMGRAEGVHPRNEGLFLLVSNVLATHVGAAAAGEIIREMPAVHDEPRLNVLSRVAVATEVWMIERERAAEVAAKRSPQDSPSAR